MARILRKKIIWITLKYFWNFHHSLLIFLPYNLALERSFCLNILLVATVRGTLYTNSVSHNAGHSHIHACMHVCNASHAPSKEEKREANETVLQIASLRLPPQSHFFQTLESPWKFVIKISDFIGVVASSSLQDLVLTGEHQSNLYFK